MNRLRPQHRIAASALGWGAVVLGTMWLPGWSASEGRAQDERATGDIVVTVAPTVTVCKRPGITGSGWAVAYDALSQANCRKMVTLIYPNHPDDAGKSLGTGTSCSADGGLTWTAAPDNSPFAGMVDMWQDLLHNGQRITFGLGFVPDRKAIIEGHVAASNECPYPFAISVDEGKTWPMECARIHCPASLGVVARSLPHIWEDENATLYMPAYAWSKTGTRSLLLKSDDRGRNWNVASTIATPNAIRDCGVSLATPWLETAVTPTSDGSFLAVIRTGSSAQSPLVTATSTDHGATWSPVDKLLAGPQRRIVAGKMPSLCLLPNGLLVLLTAHSKNHCRIYVSPDGTGRQWSEASIITSYSGGNTSMVSVGQDQLLVFAPASDQINSWQVTVTRVQANPSSGIALAPANVRVAPHGLSTEVSWDAPADAGSVDHYLVTPVLVRPPENNPDAQIYPYASVTTRHAAPHLILDRVLATGATYRFQAVAVDHRGRRSAVISSSEIVVGSVVRR